MSSFTRTLQTSSGFMGRGTKLGVTNPSAKDRLARLERERKRRVRA